MDKNPPDPSASTLPSGPAGGQDRRLGTRFPACNKAVTWRETEPVRGFLGKRDPSPTSAVMMDVSDDGAAVIAVSSDRVRLGSEIELTIDGRTCRCQIRHFRPSAAPGRTYYGVRFLNPAPTFLAIVEAIIEAGVSGQSVLTSAGPAA